MNKLQKGNLVFKYDKIQMKSNINIERKEKKTRREEKKRTATATQKKC